MSWYGHEAMSHCKKKPPVMIYYASPVGQKYGYFAATVKREQEAFLERMNNAKTS